MSLFGKRDLMRVVPIARTVAVGPGAVTLVSLEAYGAGSVLRYNAHGPSRMPADPPLLANLPHLVDEGRIGEARNYLRQNGQEWQDLGRGAGPAYGHALDFELADDRGGRYNVMLAQTSGNGDEVTAEVDVTPRLSPEASRLFITVYYTGRDWQEADKDPVDHAGQPGVQVEVEPRQGMRRS